MIGVGDAHVDSGWSFSPASKITSDALYRVTSTNSVLKIEENGRFCPVDF